MEMWGAAVSNIGVNLTMKVLGLDSASSKLQRAKAEVQNTKPLMNKAIIVLEQSQAKTFKLEGRPTWVKSKRASAQNGMTLQDTGKLRNSVTARGSTGAIREVQGNKLYFGTNIIYAPSHQFGYPKRGIPKRPFLGVYDEDIKKLEEVFKDDIKIRLKVVVGSE
jgi:phage virion morphogenesis protein